MPPVFAYILEALFSLLALVAIALFVQEAVFRLQAGPVRFRLALASRVPGRRVRTVAWGRGQGAAAVYGWVRMFFVLGILLTALTVRTRAQLFTGSRLALLIALFLCMVPFRFRRRDANRWLVLASGLFSLVIGAVVLAVRLLGFEVGDSSPYDFPPGALLLVCTAVLFAICAAICEESIVGTRVREGGIQMLCMTTPWSRIVVKHWDACEGGFVLHLAVLGPRLLGMGLEAESEVVIPVSASERPALEAFLRAHAAKAG
jgi:hypothetical protein